MEQIFWSVDLATSTMQVFADVIAPALSKPLSTSIKNSNDTSFRGHIFPACVVVPIDEFYFFDFLKVYVTFSMGSRMSDLHLYTYKQQI